MWRLSSAMIYTLLALQHLHSRNGDKPSADGVQLPMWRLILEHPHRQSCLAVWNAVVSIQLQYIPSDPKRFQPRTATTGYAGHPVTWVSEVHCGLCLSLIICCDDL